MMKAGLDASFDPYDKSQAYAEHPAGMVERRSRSYRSLVAGVRWGLSILRMALDTDPERVAQSAQFADQVMPPWEHPDYWRRDEREQMFSIDLPSDAALEKLLACIDMKNPYFCALLNEVVYGVPAMEPLRPGDERFKSKEAGDFGEAPSLVEELRARRKEAAKFAHWLNTLPPVLDALRMLDQAADRIEELEKSRCASGNVAPQVGRWEGSQGERGKVGERPRTEKTPQE